jgi:hypothetical protein
LPVIFYSRFGREKKRTQTCNENLLKGQYVTCDGMEFQVSKSRAGIKPQRHLQLVPTIIRVRQRERVQGIRHVVPLAAVVSRLLLLFLLRRRIRRLSAPAAAATARHPRPSLRAAVGMTSEIIQTPAHVHQFYSRAVAVQIYEAPERLPRVHAGEEDPLVASVHAEVNVAVGREVVVDERVGLGIALGEGLGPVAGLPGQVRAGVLGQALHRRGIVRGES